MTIAQGDYLALVARAEKAESVLIEAKKLLRQWLLWHETDNGDDPAGKTAVLLLTTTEIPLWRRTDRPEITIWVQGGTIQDVKFKQFEALPKCVLVVRDYDVDGCDEAGLRTDEEGAFYRKDVYLSSLE